MAYATIASLGPSDHLDVKGRDPSRGSAGARKGAGTSSAPLADLYVYVMTTEFAVEDDTKPRAPQTPAGTDMLGFCNNATLRKAARRLGKLYDSVLEPSGLKATQCSLLTQIYDLGNPTMADLARSLLMDLSATRHSLGPLIRDGLVLVRVDAKDRRVKRVLLTRAGLAKFKEVNKLWRKAQHRFERAFGAAQAAELRSRLKLVTSDGFEDAF
jgi:DNA-binding MarR family transcriptional regulator